MAQLLVVLIVLISAVSFLFFWPQDSIKNFFNPTNINSQVKDVQDWLQWITKKATETIETTKKTIDTKMEQAKKVQESVEKVSWSINELKQNVGSLADVSWNSWSTKTWSVWKIWNTNTWSKK